MTLLERAIQYANAAHTGQVDKAGEPYILHPLRVMIEVSRVNARDFVRALAVLHDVLEDTQEDPDDIRRDIRNRILWDYSPEAKAEFLTCLNLLTRRPGQQYRRYIEAILGGPTEAILVKLADLDDNLRDRRTVFGSPYQIPQSLRTRYQDARRVLEQELDRR